MSEVKKTWVLTTLNDVQERLEALIQTLEKEPEDYEFYDTATEGLTEVYAKLNFAVNTMRLGEAAFEEYDDDTLVAFPQHEIELDVNQWADDDEDEHTELN